MGVIMLPDGESCPKALVLSKMGVTAAIWVRRKTDASNGKGLLEVAWADDWL